MVDLNGHEAGNGGYSQRKPAAHRDSSTRKVVRRLDYSNYLNADLMASSSHSTYHTEKVAIEPSATRNGVKPLLSARPSRHRCPARAPVSTNQILNAHPISQIGIAPFTRDESQYLFSNSSYCLSYSCSSVCCSLLDGIPLKSFQVSVRGNGLESPPITPSPPCQTSSLLPAPNHFPRGNTP